jgi:hypothetical protein
MPRWIHRSVLTLVAGALLMACASAEERCRQGVEEVNSDYMFLHSVDNGRLKHDDDVVEGGMHVNGAQTQLATRNFEGCMESVEAARKHLERARGKL